MLNQLTIKTWGEGYNIVPLPTKSKRRGGKDVSSCLQSMKGGVSYLDSVTRDDHEC